MPIAESCPSRPNSSWARERDTISTTLVFARLKYYPSIMDLTLSGSNSPGLTATPKVSPTRTPSSCAPSTSIYSSSGSKVARSTGLPSMSFRGSNRGRVKGPAR